MGGTWNGLTVTNNGVNGIVSALPFDQIWTAMHGSDIVYSPGFATAGWTAWIIDVFVAPLYSDSPPPSSPNGLAGYATQLIQWP